jgi:hypothetical protein
MRNLITALALLATLLLLTTCGTVRAIQGDFDTDAPQLLAISPTQTVSGQQEVKFVAQVIDRTGGGVADEETGRVGDVLYFWDFGGGAEPNTSIDPSPVVQIRDGQRSPYECHLTLTDGGQGGEDKSETYDFTLFVTELGVAAVTPTTVLAGGSATFSALVQAGVVQEYNWDFGGAGNPGGSTQPDPTITITDVPGEYDARVFISNNFEAVEFPFTITVLPAAAP